MDHAASKNRSILLDSRTHYSSPQGTLTSFISWRSVKVLCGRCFMLGSLGAPELIVIFIVALIVFGPSKLPEFGKSLGEAIRGFKKAVNEPGKTPIDSAPSSNDAHDTNKS